MTTAYLAWSRVCGGGGRLPDCSVFLYFFFFFFSSPELQTSPVECQERESVALSFDAVQPKYAALFLKTVSIRLSEVRVRCLYLV